MVRPSTESEPAPAVVHSADRPTESLEQASGRISVRIDNATVGATRLVQRVVDLEPDEPWHQLHQHSEDVVYVATGSGVAHYQNQTLRLEPGTGCVFQPGSEYSITAAEPMRLISVLSPPPDRPNSHPPAAEVEEVAQPRVHESDEEVISAGDDESRDYMDRYFKLMIDPRYGAHYVTQFIGFIERSKAPPHTHTYDEVVYILGGQGTVHINDAAHPISAGDSVYLPPGSVHCLENQGDEPLALLGVFCPAGSPRARERA